MSTATSGDYCNPSPLSPDDPSMAPHRRLVPKTAKEPRRSFEFNETRNGFAFEPRNDFAFEPHIIADSAPHMVSVTPLSPEIPVEPSMSSLVPEAAEELQRSDDSASDDSASDDYIIGDYFAPMVSITPLSPQSPDDPSNRRLVPKTAEELQRSFQQRFDDYNKARKDASEPCIIADCEDNLIEIISTFGTYKQFFPRVYPEMIELPAFQSMLELLKDDNYCGNRLADCILLTFEELTDEDVLVRYQYKYVYAFVGSLVRFGALDVFVSVLDKFPEGDDNVFRALQTIVHLIVQIQDVAESASKETRLIEWVLKALRAPRWGEPKEYAVGFLETLLTCSKENRFQLGKMGTVAVVVNALSSLKSPNKEVEDSLDFDEEEVLDTLSRCLLLLLEDGDNKEKFANAGGVRLMIEFIQNKIYGCYYYGTSIAALGIAVKDCPSASEKFVNDDSGLDIVFPAFPDSTDKIPPSFTHEKEEIEEHLTSLIALLTDGIAKTKKYLLLEKFKENDCENVTWLTELLIQYSSKAEARKNHLKDNPLDRSEYFMEKLRNDLSMLQSIAVILGYLWSSKNYVISARIEKELSHHKLEKKHVRDILSTYRDNIGDSSESSAAKAVITEYIDSLEENPDQGIDRM